MAKFKPAGRKRAPARRRPPTVPCLVILFIGLLLMFGAFYVAFMGGTK